VESVDAFAPLRCLARRYVTGGAVGGLVGSCCTYLLGTAALRSRADCFDGRYIACASSLHLLYCNQLQHHFSSVKKKRLELVADRCQWRYLKLVLN